MDLGRYILQRFLTSGVFPSFFPFLLSGLLFFSLDFCWCGVWFLDSVSFGEGEGEGERRELQNSRENGALGQY